jgi:hypothetical protein
MEFNNIKEGATVEARLCKNDIYGRELVTPIVIIKITPSKDTAFAKFEDIEAAVKKLNLPETFDWMIANAQST